MATESKNLVGMALTRRRERGAASWGNLNALHLLTTKLTWHLLSTPTPFVAYPDIWVLTQIRHLTREPDGYQRDRLTNQVLID